MILLMLDSGTSEEEILSNEAFNIDFETLELLKKKNEEKNTLTADKI